MGGIGVPKISYLLTQLRHIGEMRQPNELRSFPSRSWVRHYDGSASDICSKLHNVGNSLRGHPTTFGGRLD